VVVAQVEDGVAEVSLVDPAAMLGVVAYAALRPVAEEAAARLDRVAASLRG
jgi:hypothetical protein